MGESAVVRIRSTHKASANFGLTRFRFEFHDGTLEGPLDLTERILSANPRIVGLRGAGRTVSERSAHGLDGHPRILRGLREGRSQSPQVKPHTRLALHPRLQLAKHGLGPRPDL